MPKCTWSPKVKCTWSPKVKCAWSPKVQDAKCTVQDAKMYLITECTRWPAGHRHFTRRQPDYCTSKSTPQGDCNRRYRHIKHQSAHDKDSSLPCIKYFQYFPILLHPIHVTGDKYMTADTHQPAQHLRNGNCYQHFQNGNVNQSTPPKWKSTAASTNTLQFRLAVRRTSRPDGLRKTWSLAGRFRFVLVIVHA